MDMDISNLYTLRITANIYIYFLFFIIYKYIYFLLVHKSISGIFPFIIVFYWDKSMD